MSTKRYTDEEKAAALVLLDTNGGNIKRTARDLKMPPQTLRKWRDGVAVNPTVVEMAEEKKRTLVSMFDEIARAYADRALRSDAIENMKGKDAVVAAAVAIDKLRLLQGESTAINEVRGALTEEQRAEKVAEILNRARARRVGRQTPAPDFDHGPSEPDIADLPN